MRNAVSNCGIGQELRFAMRIEPDKRIIGRPTFRIFSADQRRSRALPCSRPRRELLVSCTHRAEGRDLAGLVEVIGNLDVFLPDGSSDLRDDQFLNRLTLRDDEQELPARRLPQAGASGVTRQGLDVTADMYPYPAGSTGLSALLPSWAHAGGRESLLARLADPADRARIRAALDGPGIARDAGWDGIVICGVPRPARVRGSDPRRDRRRSWACRPPRRRSRSSARRRATPT